MKASARLEPTLGSVVGAYNTAAVDALLRPAQVSAGVDFRSAFERLAHVAAGAATQDLPITRSADLHEYRSMPPPH